jgi:inosine/xanthosine triphosphate pyrophosphatase family protein
MLNILFATSNPGKLLRYKKYYSGSEFNFYSCTDLGIEIPCILEDGTTEKDNALIKANGYYNALMGSEVELPKGKWIVLSLDTGLYFDKVNKLEQPGSHIKRIAGAGVFNETIEEKFSKMSVFYSALAKKYGGKLDGYFRDIFILYNGQKTQTVEAKRCITLTDTMHTKDLNFPIGSYFKVEDKYFHELDDTEYKKYLEPSFSALNAALSCF